MKSLVDMKRGTGRTMTGSIEVVMTEGESNVLNFGNICEQHLIYMFGIGYVMFDF